MSEHIPGPRGLPFVGNAYSLDPDNSLLSFMNLAKIYGPIFKLNIGGMENIYVTRYEEFSEMCDEKRFCKTIAGPVLQARNGLKDGLFTSWSDEHAWQVAHRILTPVFGPLAVRGMLGEMHDIASQMLLKWARMPETPVDAAPEFTKLTLDTIALCSMETRFNSFYRESMHPFPKAMTEFLQENLRRVYRPAFVNRMMTGAEATYQANIKHMRHTAEEIVKNARANPSGKNNLLNAMLTRTDPKTGETMSDDNIVSNIITFLVAGHETTAGFLSFLSYQLSSNLDVQRKAQAEIDSVVGDGPVAVEHLNKLPYLTAIMRETMRLTPTITQSPTVQPVPDSPEQVVLAGKYTISKNVRLVPILPLIMKDKDVWGEDADKFRPERCLDENFSKIPKHAWKPFGNGIRSCIGQYFSWQETTLALALILQNFTLKMEDPSYQLRIKQTGTIKPDNFHFFAVPREGIDAETLDARLAGNTIAKTEGDDSTATEQGSEKKPMAIFWGGNAGTSESLANSLAKTAGANGFEAQINALDDAVDAIPKDKPVAIITSSYEGQPPDNATQFVKYIETMGEDAAKGVHYAVFGNGNHEWKQTFQRIPTLCDDLLEKAGANRLAPRGVADVAVDDVFDVFETWTHDYFWPAVKKAYGGSKDGLVDALNSLEGEIITDFRASHLKQAVQQAVVVQNDIIAQTDEALPEKRFIKFKLPSGTEYQAGDYLAVLPTNPAQSIHRVMKHFGIPFDAMINIKSKNTVLPNEGPVSVHDILHAYVELNQLATRRGVSLLATRAHEETERQALERIGSSDSAFEEEIAKPRTTILDLLEKYTSVSLNFIEYLSLLPQLRLRQYSISSSPLHDPETCSITLGVLDKPRRTVDGHRFLGVASNYLASLAPGDLAHVMVKSSHASFHLPADADKTPVIMVAAGTGLAPFRGFIQERAVLKAAGRDIAPALLFYGTQNEEQVLHRDELEQWQTDGAVTLRYAFSRDHDHALACGCKYVQDRFWADRTDVRELFKKGARIFVCGSGKVGEGVRDKSLHIYQEVHDLPRVEDGNDWFDGIRNERYMVEVFD